MQKYWLIIIVILGLLLRIFGISWDAGHYLHPDERFLAMVIDKITIPTNIFNYLNPYISSLNPYNNDFGFFVYGMFPTTLAKIIAGSIFMDNYGSFYVVGRLLSMFFDVLNIIIVWKICELFEIRLSWKKEVKVCGAFLYAISVLPIQLSHFFTSDIFLSFFILLTVYLYLRYFYENKIIFLILSALACGAGISSKLNAVYVIPLLSLLFWKIKQPKMILRILLWTLVVGVTILILDPKFATYQFLDNIKALNSLSDPNSYYPPGIQWLKTTPIIFPLINIAFFGLGIGYFMLLIYGYIKALQANKYVLNMLLLWIVVMFLWQGSQAVKTMRYFIFLYPFFAIVAGYGLSNIKNIYIKIFTILLTIAWPLLFLNIYVTEHSRIQASKWIYQNISPNTRILTEYWDDPLPLGIEGYSKSFQEIQLSVFDQDTPEKIKKLNENFISGSYYILSSNRAYASIMNNPDKYPYMAQFYERLISGKNPAFKKVAEFTNYPGVDLGFINIVISDDWSEEAFTVYDHPKVLIYKVL